MNTTKSFYIITFIAGLINLLIAANLYYNNSMAFGFSVGKFGGVQEGSISLTGATVIGCTLLIVSVFVFWGYQKEKKEIQKKWREEENESIIKSRRKRNNPAWRGCSAGSSVPLIKRKIEVQKPIWICDPYIDIF